MAATSLYGVTTVQTYIYFIRGSVGDQKFMKYLVSCFSPPWQFERELKDLNQVAFLWYDSVSHVSVLASLQHYERTCPSGCSTRCA